MGSSCTIANTFEKHYKSICQGYVTALLYSSRCNKAHSKTSCLLIAITVTPRSTPSFKIYARS